MLHSLNTVIIILKRVVLNIYNVQYLLFNQYVSSLQNNFLNWVSLFARVYSHYLGIKLQEKGEMKRI